MFLLRVVLVSLCIFMAEANNTAIFENLGRLALWEEYSEKLQNFLIPPNVVLTGDCYQQLNEYAKGLSNSQEWALRMFDSASKIPAGIFYETSGDLGIFDECMGVKGETKTGVIYGKYCLGKISFKNSSQLGQEFEISNPNRLPTLINSLGLKFATCLPHACTISDIKQIYLSFGIDYDIDDINCQSKITEPKLDELAIFTIAFFGVIISFMIVSTVYDVYNYYTEQRPTLKLLTAFSVFKNGKKLFSTNYKSDQLTCLNGIRTICLAGIIIFHKQAILLAESMILNTSNLLTWYEDICSVTIIGIRGIVDAFFFMSGMVITYGFSIAVKKNPKINIIKYYCHRCIRLTPPLAAAVLVMASLIKYIVSGPQWPAVIKDSSDNCRNYWWTTLLYIQNYVHPTEQCLSQAWYLSVDTQLYLLSPLFLTLFHTWPKLKYFVLSFIIICLSIFPFVTAWFGEYRLYFDPSLPLPNNEYATYLYFPTHLRAGPWFVGLAAGYIVYETKQSNYSFCLKTIKGKSKFIAYWLVIMGIFYICYLFSYIISVEEYDKLTFSLYVAIIGPIWAIGLCLLTVVCVNGYGGFINWALSNPYMQILSKLSYSMYLLHNMVIYREVHNQRAMLLYQNFEQFYRFWSDFMYTAILAIFWVLAFEYPFAEIESFIWGNNRNKKLPASLTENNETKEV